MNWKKSDDGFTKTPDLHYHITPEFWGRVRPQSYRLEWIADIREGVAYSRRVRIGSYATQRAAKLAAEQHAAARSPNTKCSQPAT